MCFLPLKSSHYPSRPVPVPDLFGKYPTRTVPKSKTPTRQTLFRMNIYTFTSWCCCSHHLPNRHPNSPILDDFSPKNWSTWNKLQLNVRTLQPQTTQFHHMHGSFTQRNLLLLLNIFNIMIFLDKPHFMMMMMVMIESSRKEKAETKEDGWRGSRWRPESLYAARTNDSHLLITQTRCKHTFLE